jgi:hypothetical protein
MRKLDLKILRMKATKAYIIAINTEKSIEYASHCVNSCKLIGLDYEVVEGFTGASSAKEAFDKIDTTINLRQKEMDSKAACITATHFSLWRKIADNKECAIILEHDALMLHKLDIDVPDNMILTLGYKYRNPFVYDHIKAGPSQRIRDIAMHGGAHAYALTYITAEILLKEIRDIGVPQAIDNTYFMRNFPEYGMRSSVPLGLTDPISAVGWVRDSTIWEHDAHVHNFTYLTSFIDNCSDISALMKKIE